MSKLSTVWAFSAVASRLPEVIAGAALFGENVAALVVGSQADAAVAYAAGAHVVYLVEKDDSRILEDYADTLAKVIAEGPTPTLVLVAGTRCGKALASLLGVRLDAGVISDAMSVSVDDGAVTGKHMVYGGLALGEEKITSPVAIVVVGSGVFAAPEASVSGTGETVTVPFTAPATGVKCVERRARQGSRVDLRQAKRIVSVGRGIARQDDLAMAEELSALLEAELGCSRPIAEAEKWMSHERYIGISGVMPNPDIYMALGISGQIQHMVAVNGSQTIVAVNKDKNAPIFEFADYGIVADIYKVVPALITALKR